MSLVGILMLPSYIRYMGAESLGLVGFFLMLSGWLQFLDMGMTSVFSRQCSLFRAGVISHIDVRKLLRTLEYFFGTLALSIIFLGFILSSWLAESWLRLVTLNQSTVAWTITIMACLVGLRWISALYRSGLVGLERQGDVNVITAIVATIKYVLVVPYFIFVSSDILNYFQYQLFAGFLELFLYGRWLRGVALPKYLLSVRPSIKTLREVLPFASSVAFTSAISIALVNFDKVILSRILDLTEYGYFTLAVIVAGGLLYFISPVTQIFQPRFSVLVAQNKYLELRARFSELTQFLCSLMSGLGFGIALFAEPILLEWSGSHEVAFHAGPILFWYALGNAIIGILSLPYILQFAHGMLRLHVFGTAAFAIWLIPLTVWSAISYGAVGAGRVWLTSNLLFLLIWVPIIFKNYAFGSYARWIVRDVIFPSIASALPILIFSNMNLFELKGFHLIVSLIIVSLVGISLGVLVGVDSRRRIVGLLANAL